MEFKRYDVSLNKNRKLQNAVKKAGLDTFNPISEERNKYGFYEKLPLHVRISSEEDEIIFNKIKLEFEEKEKQAEAEQQERLKKAVSNITPAAVAQALYVLNKDAKELRNEKNANYGQIDSINDSLMYSNYGQYNPYENRSVLRARRTRLRNIASYAKYNQEEKYNLKTMVLNRLSSLGLTTINGYHIIGKNSYFVEYLFEGFSFHMPVQSEPHDIPFLGTINHYISESKTISTPLANSETCEAILKAFLNSGFTNS